MIGPTGKAVCLTRGPRCGALRSLPTGRPAQARSKARPRHGPGTGTGPGTGVARHGRARVQWFRAACLVGRWRTSRRARWPAPHPRLTRASRDTPHATRLTCAGCGKTEVARRLAKLAQAPFIKVEAIRSNPISLTLPVLLTLARAYPNPNPPPILTLTLTLTLILTLKLSPFTLTSTQVEATKFTEVGFVGKDVDQIIRDLVDVALALEKTKALEEIKDKVRSEQGLAGSQQRALSCLPALEPALTSRAACRWRPRWRSASSTASWAPPTSSTTARPSATCCVTATSTTGSSRSRCPRRSRTSTLRDRSTRSSLTPTLTHP